MTSPVTLIRKKDGSPRVCVDYTFLDNHTKWLCFPLPLMDNLPQLLNRHHRVFTTIDLKVAYYSLLMTKRAVPLAAIVTAKGA